jgi:hypothetical protein
MPTASVKLIAFAALALLCGAGCHRPEAKPLATLPVEQLDPVLQQVFANADPEIRTQASQYVKAMQDHDWSGAMAKLKELRSHQELTQEQRATLARVHQTTVQQLNASADQGDDSAAAVMSAYKASK